jgi:radical SAM protein with 4Fe4S-binding SPASM domain
MCIEPNGEVLPCQSYYQSLGNFLTDDWESIWHHPLAEGLRKRKYISEQCEDCLIVSQCGGGCPLAPPQTAWQTLLRMEA